MNDTTITKILESAIRAPSTHNSQPWLFRVNNGKIEVFLNPKYVLPFADKETRDLHISIGCMLENLSIAASIEKLNSIISYGPFPEKNKLAEIILNNTNNDPSDLCKTLFKTIPDRVNARGIFLDEEIPEELLEKIKTLNENSDISIDFIKDRGRINKIAELTALAIIKAYNEKGFRKEMSHWMNHNLSNKKEGLPGYSLKMPLLISLFIPILIRYFNIGPFLAKLNIKSISSAPLILILSGEDGPKSWMNIGKLAERIMLYAQSQTYQTSIYVGSIEIGDIYKEVQQIIKTQKRPQFIFLIGHIPGKHRTTPRHKLIDKMI